MSRRATRTAVAIAALLWAGAAACSEPAGDTAAPALADPPAVAQHQPVATDPAAPVAAAEPTPATLEGLAFPAVDLGAPQVSYRQSLPGVQLCRPALATWFDGQPRLIASDRLGLTVYDRDLQIVQTLRSDYRAVDLTMLPTPDGGRQLVLLGTTLGSDTWADRIVAVDAGGELLWSHELRPDQLSLRTRLLPLHDVGSPSGVAVLREGSGLIAFDLAGRVLWEQRELAHSAPATHPEVPGWLGVPGGTSALRDNAGALRHEVGRVPDHDSVYVTANALLPGSGTPPHLVVGGSLSSHRGEDTGRDVIARVGWEPRRPFPWIADIPPVPEGGAGLRELATHTPEFAVLDRGGDAPRLAALLPDARLLVFDADGTLRQCSLLAPLGPDDWVSFESGVEPPPKLISLRAGPLGDGQVLLVGLVSRTLVYDVLDVD